MMNWPIARIYVRLLLLMHAVDIVVAAGFLPFEWIQTESQRFRLKHSNLKFIDMNESNGMRRTEYTQKVFNLLVRRNEVRIQNDWHNVMEVSMNLWQRECEGERENEEETH